MAIGNLSTPAMIYFVQGAQGGAIKIGKAANVLERVKTLQASSPIPLKLLAATSGGSMEERELHKRFSHCRLHGEWFEEAAELIEYILSLPPFIIKEDGTIDDPTLPKMTDEPICKLYNAGYSMRAIGSIYGVTGQRIEQILRRNSVKRTNDRPRKPVKPIEEYHALLIGFS